MGKIKIAINGFGRIGRIFTRIIWDNPRFELVALNSRSKCDIYAHLLKYDSIYGPWEKEVSFKGNEAIVIDGKEVPMYHEGNIEDLDWGKHDVDIVIESTGVFRDRASSEKHIKSGAKYVLISAPAKEEDTTMIYNINHGVFDPDKHKMISAASCTTTCLAPVVQILQKHFGIKHGTVITTHSYTNDQHLVDHPHKADSFRRSRASAISIIPTSTGAAKAIGKVIPELNGKLDGNALRVPVPVPSIISFVAELEKGTDRDEVNKIFHEEKANYEGSLDVCDIGLVSADYIRSPFGATVDTLTTVVTDKTQVFVQAWYDNEWGYVSQMTKLLESMGEKISK
ncbi:type I glyceraldehyde-3-phosphate dehydrogenase [Candidatus Parcubacteria bacterium]|jgi:glyceraldehyde 3-phosphate dehydrogenase|nr:type I glyceraldehyde-3-phosphate dehydrogenase [Candidatus Parcubacteria bacterium]MBT3948606.1 type I glyceraldehyde-3-phosphate dehydrogenase [Candidatus Parcubacteria bacterium]